MQKESNDFFKIIIRNKMNTIIQIMLVWFCLHITITQPQNTTISPTDPLDNFIVGCRVEKKCISLSLNESRCANCNQSVDNCDVLAAWKSDVSKGLAYFELYTAVPNMDYVALGVSRNEVMGGSDVFACQLDVSGNVVLKDTWNTVGENSVNLLDPTQEGIEMIDWSYKNGGIYCKFSRDAIGRGYTDLNLFQDQLHILTAVGIGRDLGLKRGVGYHTQKCYTTEKYSIAHQITSGCFETKECYSVKEVNSCEPCSGSSCKFVFTWAKDTSGTKVIFEIQSKYAELDYAAVGLSQNELMGDSDVFACQLSVDGGVVVKDTWNTIGISSYNVLDSVQTGIQMIDSVFSDGVLYCKFSRDVKRSSSHGFNLFGENFNFLFAVGKGKDNGFKKGVGYHTEKCASFSKYDLNTQFTKPVDITAGCRETKQCLFIGTINDTCDPCLDVSCEFIAAWYFDAVTNGIVFELEIQRSNVEYLEISVSNEAIVNGSEVYACHVDGINGVTVQAAYVPNTSTSANKTSLRVELISSRVSDSSLYCKFERSEHDTDHGFRSLTDSFHLSFATKFRERTESGSKTINETCKTADTYFLKSTNVDERVDYKSFCGDNHCLAYKDLSKCQQDMNCVKSNSCEYIIAWSYPDDKNQVTFYIRLNISGQSWAAIGFSNDTRMGHDDVIGCQLDTQGSMVAKDTWNPDGYAPNELDENQKGIKLISGHYSNSILTCVMTRSTIPPVNSRGYNLLARPYYLFSAVGLGLDNELKPTGLPIHTYKCISNQKIQLDAVKHSGSNLPFVTGLAKAHGITMLFTWLIVIASGIFIARFCRLYVTQKQWFNMHRIVNGLGVVLACMGVIFAIIGASGWYIMPGNTKLIFHQLFGVIITIGILVNPLIALCRCKADHPKRWQFNLMHTLIGVSVETLAMINISLGLSLYYTNNSTQEGLIVYLVIGIPTWFIMQAVYAIKTVRKPRRSNKESTVEAMLVNDLEEKLIVEDIWEEVSGEGDMITKEPLIYKVRYRTKSFCVTAFKLLSGVAYWVSMVIVFITTSSLILAQK